MFPKIRKFFLFSMMMTEVGTAAYADCLSQTDNPAIKECLQGEYEKADKDLNAVYSQAMSAFDQEGKTELKAAQLAWIKFRDSDAALHAGRFRGGTFAGVATLSRLRDLTTQRVKDLKDLMKQGAQ